LFISVTVSHYLQQLGSNAKLAVLVGLLWFFGWALWDAVKICMEWEWENGSVYC